MYTRSFNEDGALSLPEGYSGTMLESEHTSTAEEKGCQSETAPASGIPLGFSGLGSLFKGWRASELKIGTEELLIAAVALFLLFSKNGDRECAIMLLLTLFIAK